MSKNSSYSNEWLEIAKNEWNRVKVMIKEEDFGDAAFHLQQSLEKY